MARWMCFYAIVSLILVNSVMMMFSTADQDLSVKRHLGSARDKHFRAKQAPASNYDHLFQRQQQTLPSPDLLRSRWVDLFNEQFKIHEPLITEE